MARLIDADALFRQVSKNLGSTAMYLPIDFQEEIVDAPTIDAIPVEWLQKYTAVGTTPRGDRLTEGNERLIVHRILNDWQKEQEAR